MSSNIKGLFKRGFHPDMVPTQSSPKSVPLDEQQDKAVNTFASNVIVIAGAGSGKTRVLTERVKFLLKSGFNPSGIVAITFTNMAAEEMKIRLKDVPGIDSVFIGTIHSFANKLACKSGKVFSIFDLETDIRFHTELIEKYCKYLTVDKYLKYMNLMKEVEDLKRPEFSVSKFFSPAELTELRVLDRKVEMVESDLEEGVYKEYPESVHTLCRDRDVITFDQLLTLADEYFSSIDASVENLLVDEFQDIGVLEFKFLIGLKSNRNYFVGDDYQSIYGFKGGNVNIFLKLATGSYNFEVHYLTNNYRNSLPVLRVAETVISQVKHRVKKEVTHSPNFTAPEGEVKFGSKKDIRLYLTEYVLRGNSDYRDWFILTRTNKELFDIVQACRSMKIPCITFKREGLTLSELNSQMRVNAVKILTVHTSKGLESKNVILYGNFPLQVPEYRLNEDERKVMYVGITRAKENLIILS